MPTVLSRIAQLLHPLSDFYEEEGRGLPDIELLDGTALPAPYRDLLVHENDMTPTLEAFCGERLHLRVLKVHELADELHRQVVLVTDADRPLEFGAIRIRLDEFDGAAREDILAGYKPLGTILAEYGIRHVCHPNAFFRAESDERTAAAFRVPEHHRLFGRHNVLESLDGTLLAEVVEILPPLEP